MKKARSRGRTWLRMAMTAGVMFAALEAVGVVAASANAPNPNPDTAGTYTVNGDGSVTVNLNGTWMWPVPPGQTCAGRYGEGWAVGWWGIGSSKTGPSFSLTNATEVTGVATTSTGTITDDGSIPIGSGPNPSSGYFYVSSEYNGQNINSPTTCTDLANGSSQGNWAASATYPNLGDVPRDSSGNLQICVNLYDEHGSEGKPTKFPGSDFGSLTDNDNSIKTNAFNPTTGNGYCTSIVPKQQVPVGTIGGVGLAALVALGGGVVMWRHRRHTAHMGAAG